MVEKWKLQPSAMRIMNPQRTQNGSALKKEKKKKGELNILPLCTTPHYINQFIWYTTIIFLTYDTFKVSIQFVVVGVQVAQICSFAWSFGLCYCDHELTVYLEGNPFSLSDQATEI